MVIFALHAKKEDDEDEEVVVVVVVVVIVIVVVVVVVVVAQSEGSVVTPVVEYDEFGTGHVERAQIDASSPL